MEFLIGGLAAVGAGFFTNPLEVLKTRMQLQGELRAKGQYAVYYKNVLHAGYVVAKNDGILALQKGLVPALWVQLILNGMRFGTFRFADTHGYIRDKKGKLIFYKSLVIGGFGGILGQFFCSPLFLIKTHLQSQSVAAIAVGHQHQPEGSWRALKKLYVQNGLRGLFRGGEATVPRAFFGSVSQLLSFEYTKQYLYTHDYFKSNVRLTSFLASMVGGVVISITITPFDLIMTRLYNQPTDAEGRGKLYRNYMDCVVKIYQTEGISAYYKGIGPMMIRLGPHSVLCLVFWDELQSLYEKYSHRR